jgi:signal transduction histidine kinase
MATVSANVARLHSELRIASTLLATLAAVCVTALGAYLYRSVMQPLGRINRAARAIAGGQFDHHLETTGSAEFASLSATFNSMADTLAEQRDSTLAARKRLGDEVDARTRELSEANARLRSVDSRRAQLLADVSHQLRTPLTIVRGEADVALRGEHTEEEQHQALLRIRGQAQALGELLEELINFARADNQTYEYVPERVTMEEVAAAAVQDGRALADGREIKIEARFNQQASWINADFSRLKQALVIGLDNAVKHSPPGASIHVETNGAGGQVGVSICDEGPGIAEEDLPHVFERFYRSRSESDLFNAGLGIGLAIAKHIVDRHSGTITLENRPEGGACFRIVLPAFSEHVDEDTRH